MKMEDWEKYTAKNNEFEFQVNDHKFTCEEITVGEEVDFFNYYIEPNGQHNIAKLRMVQCTKLKNTPFTTKWIKHVFNTFYPDIKLEDNISWTDLSLSNRLLFLGKLDVEYIQEIIKNVANHYTNKEETVKN